MTGLRSLMLAVRLLVAFGMMAGAQESSAIGAIEDSPALQGGVNGLIDL